MTAVNTQNRYFGVESMNASASAPCPAESAVRPFFVENHVVAPPPPPSRAQKGQRLETMETTKPLTLAPFPTGTQSHTYRTVPTAFLAAPIFPKLIS